MKYFALAITIVVIAVVSVSSTNAQVVDKTVDKTKEVTKEAAKVTTDAVKKTSVVVTDTLSDAADKTRSATESGAKTTTTKASTFGKNTLNVTENVVGQTYEGGKYLTVTSWDGAKWVSKQVWYPNKSAPAKP